MRTLFLTAIAVTVQLAAGAPAVDARDLPERARDVVQRSLAPGGPGPQHLEIDNVFGSIVVAGYDGATVELEATRTTFARTSGDAAEALREVTLDVTAAESGGWRVRVNGPFREPCRDDERRVSRPRDYVVRYDFVLKVPRRTGLRLRTVNDGEIRAGGVWGGFDVEHVNGGIEMLDVAGPGRVRTVNGDVRVVFRENPSAASSFATLNGDVVVSLQPGLAADFRLKTFNGRIYSDFDVSRLPAIVPAAERRDGRFVYRADRAFAVRVGSGGPELSFESFSGDIRILQGGQ
jgi:hypothetical protein